MTAAPGGVPPRIMTPPGAGSIVDPQGNEILTDAQKAERREVLRDQLLMSIAKSLQTIATGVSEGFPRFDQIGVASANALSVIAAGMNHLGLVDVDEMEAAAAQAAGEQAEQDAEAELDADLKGGN